MSLLQTNQHTHFTSSILITHLICFFFHDNNSIAIISLNYDLLGLWNIRQNDGGLTNGSANL